MACTPSPFAISPSTNRITTTGYTYDSNGNLLTDNSHGYVYDTENRLTCVVDPVGGLCTTSGATVYTYDAQGRRVTKAQGNGTLIEDEVYDLQGHLTSLHNGSTVLKSEFYTPGGWHLATYTSGTLYYIHTDHLGTERLVTNSTGGAVETCHDSPFGMNLSCAGSADPSAMRYTGLPYDAESGTSHAENRQLRMQIGRWMTADPAGKGAAELDDPQTWNLYAYVRNDPMTLTDPSGLVPLEQGPERVACADSPGCQDKGAGPTTKKSDKKEPDTDKKEPVRAPKTSITVPAGLLLSEDVTATELIAGSGPGFAILVALLGYRACAANPQGCVPILKMFIGGPLWLILANEGNNTEETKKSKSDDGRQTNAEKNTPEGSKDQLDGVRQAQGVKGHGAIGSIDKSEKRNDTANRKYYHDSSDLPPED